MKPGETLPHPGLSERVTGLATSGEGFSASLLKLELRVSTGFAELQTSLAKLRDTNWPAIAAMIASVSILYAAAIRPLNQEGERATKAGEVLAQAVLVQNDEINNLRIQLKDTEKQTALLELEMRLGARLPSPP